MRVIQDLNSEIPARGLISSRTEFLTETKGEGVMNHSFLEFRPYSGTVESRKKWCFSFYGKWRKIRLFNLQLTR